MQKKYSNKRTPVHMPCSWHPDLHFAARLDEFVQDPDEVLCPENWRQITKASQYTGVSMGSLTHPAAAADIEDLSARLQVRKQIVEGVRMPTMKVMSYREHTKEEKGVDT